MWYMSTRSRKKQQEAMSFRDNLQIGQEVMTGSGLFGTVVAVEDDVITLESTPGSQTRWLKAAIAKLVDPPVDEVYEDEDEDDEYGSEEYESDVATEQDGTVITPFGDEDDSQGKRQQ